MSETNGIEIAPGKPKTITLKWDSANSNLVIDFQTDDFPSWHAVKGILKIAESIADGQIQAQNVVAAISQMQQAVQDQHIRGKILRN
jgi:hypothetical protein